MKREKPQMTKKEAFIKIIQTEIFDRTDIYAENYPDEYELAASFWEDFKDGKEVEAAERFRKCILSQGGIDDPNVLFKNFKGKEFSIEPFLKSKGLID